jgi:hypothetical protein
MVAIDREVGGSTMIRVSIEVKQMIEEEKIIPREPLNDCIKRGILENRKHRQHPTIETKEALETELKEIVTNPNSPGGGVNDEYLYAWNAAHPEDRAKKFEIIHHINGNHNDNRPENLEKVSSRGHADAHIQLHKEFPLLNSSKGNDIVGKPI